MIICYPSAQPIDHIIVIGYNDSTYVADIKASILIDNDLHRFQTFNVVEPNDFYAANPSDNYNNTAFIVSVFKNLQERIDILDYIKLHNLNKFSFISDTTTVDYKNILVGAGTCVLQYCVLAYQSDIGEDCLIAPYSLISHRVKLGRGVNVCPATVINGSVEIGDYTYVGSRSTFKDGVVVPANTYLGMMSTVNKSIDTAGTYLGNPVRRLNDSTVFDHFSFSPDIALVQRSN
jgi:acyl-[acyl carrier protein]--UDP-N-acetylglucosamine O-acyltransferase